MDGYYSGSMFDDEENILEWRADSNDFGMNGAFFVALTLSIAVVAFARLSAYMSLF